ncbi:MAG: hypothetical protein KF912_07430 [Phycisphaeraceae bacterium]|nr:hypothetical protein [Phycisphaeraceae bacterium]MBX3367132.1 hypothetical protein [Phycisphaeraceae bacterium]
MSDARHFFVHRTRLFPVAIAAICLSMAQACSRPTDTAQPATPTPPTQVAEGDGILLSTTIDRREASTSELLQLDIRTTAKAGLVLSSPELTGHQSLEVLEVVRLPAIKRPDGVVEQRWTAILEPGLPGSALAPGVKLAIRDANAGTLSYIATDPIPVAINSVLQPDDPIAVTELRAAAMPPPAGEPIWHQVRPAVAGAVAGLIVILVVAGAAVVIIRKRLRAPRIAGSRKTIATLVLQAPSMSPTERSRAIGTCARLLRLGISERTEVPAHAMTELELLDRCPQLSQIPGLIDLMADIERMLCSGSDISHAGVTDVLSRTDRALDDLSTFVPTRYLTESEVAA